MKFNRYSVTVKADAGIHGRECARIVKEMNHLNVEARISKGTISAHMGSILGLLSLYLPKGEKAIIEMLTYSGNDLLQAKSILKKYFELEEITERVYEE